MTGVSVGGVTGGVSVGGVTVGCVTVGVSVGGVFGEVSEVGSALGDVAPSFLSVVVLAVSDGPLAESEDLVLRPDRLSSF